MAHVTTRNYLIDRAPKRIELLGDKTKRPEPASHIIEFPGGGPSNFPAPPAATIGHTSSSTETSRYPEKSRGLRRVWRNCRVADGLRVLSVPEHRARAQRVRTAANRDSDQVQRSHVGLHHAVVPTSRCCFFIILITYAKEKSCSKS
jgi:hypothetical protein